MSKALKTVATIAGVVALTFAIPGIGPAIGLSVATAGKVAAFASLPAPSTALGYQLKPRHKPPLDRMKGGSP